MPGTNRYLADALVDAANYSACIAVLLRIRSSDDMMPWCSDCPDYEDCWAWNAMHLLTWQQITEAKRRDEARKRRKLAQTWNGGVVSLIKVMKAADGKRSGTIRPHCV